MTNQSSYQIPEKLSQFIRDALDDLEKCESNLEKFDIDMGAWLDVFPSGRCTVCLAGAVMAQRYNAIDLVGGQYGYALGPAVLSAAGRASYEDVEKIRALDSVRIGNIVNAYFKFHGIANMGDTAPQIVRDLTRPLYEFPQYGYDSAVFKSEIRRIADELERAGL